MCTSCSVITPGWSVTTEEAYNDNKSHSLFLSKQTNKVAVYVDDIRVDNGEVVLPTSAVNLKAPTSGGLYLGGVPSPFQIK